MPRRTAEPDRDAIKRYLSSEMQRAIGQLCAARRKRFEDWPEEGAWLATFGRHAAEQIIAERMAAGEGLTDARLTASVRLGIPEATVAGWHRATLAQIERSIGDPDAAA